MAIARSELAGSLHRLANYLECQLAQLLPELLAESRTEAAAEITFRGCHFVESLREARDGREGGAV
jgi:hypothetical protein